MTASPLCRAPAFASRLGAFLALLCPVLAAAQEPTPPDGGGDPGLYVIVEATQRPLDALLVLPPVCQIKKPDCEVVEQVLRNDVRLSGFLRSMAGSARSALAVFLSVRLSR